MDIRKKIQTRNVVVTTEKNGFPTVLSRDRQTDRQTYSKTVLGCKENRQYEKGVQKIVFRGRRPR